MTTWQNKIQSNKFAYLWHFLDVQITNQYIENGKKRYFARILASLSVNVEPHCSNPLALWLNVYYLGNLAFDCVLFPSSLCNPPNCAPDYINKGWLLVGPWLYRGRATESCHRLGSPPTYLVLSALTWGTAEWHSWSMCFQGCAGL